MSNLSSYRKYAKECQKESKEKYISSIKFRLFYEKKKYYISLMKTKGYILLKIGDYEIRLTVESLSSASKLVFDSLDEIYDYLRDALYEKMVEIKNIKQDQFIILSFINNVNGKNKEYFLTLIYKNENKDNIINTSNNELSTLSKNFRNKINPLENEPKKMKTEFFALKTRLKNGKPVAISKPVNYKTNDLKKNNEIENGYKKNDEIKTKRNVICISNNSKYFKSREEQKLNNYRKMIELRNTIGLKKIFDIINNSDDTKNSDQKNSIDIKKFIEDRKGVDEKNDVEIQKNFEPKKNIYFRKSREIKKNIENKKDLKFKYNTYNKKSRDVSNYINTKKNIDIKNNINNKNNDEISNYNSENNKVIINNKINDNSINTISNTNDIEYISEIAKDSYSKFFELDNSFTVFSSLHEILYLIYATSLKSIKCINLGEEQLIAEIKNAHEEYISNFRHIVYKKDDIIMSISCKINNIKVWNVNSWECILNLKDIYLNGFLNSACFLILDKNLYIISSNCNWLKAETCEKIKIYDLNGEIYKEINRSNENTCYIDTYNDEIKEKIYIITGNDGYAKTYDIDKNRVYLKYQDQEKGGHWNEIVKKIGGIVLIFEACVDGFVRIWKFHDGTIFNKININSHLYGICLWDDEYLFVGNNENKILFVDIKNSKILQIIGGHNNKICCIKKLKDINGKEYLITQGAINGKIKIWANKM